MSDDVHEDLADIRARLEVLEQRLDEAAASDRTDEVLRRLDTLQDRLAGGQGSLLDQLQDNLADVASGEVVGSLWEEVRELRTDLGGAGGGLDEAARESLEALRAEVEGIGAALAARTEPTADPAVAGMREELRLLADDVRAVIEAPAAPAPSDAEDRLAPLVDELATLRAELTEGLVVEPSDALLDQVAALRDFVASGLDRLQQAVAAREATPPPATVDTTPLDDLATRLRSELDRLAAVGATPSAAPAMDDDTVELLREEIRAAGGVSDQLVEALRDELKALRRRIAVKASEKVLDEEQLDQIAEAVAARLGKG
ncbi:MAG TPA: hypothetical protein VFU14_16850 [Acidimicrobiales bacterium]|nr:hypothetical protein [Acidimicrobiales bacterium]